MNRVGLQCEADVGKRVGWKDRARTMQRSLTDAAQQLIGNQQVIGWSRPSEADIRLTRRLAEGARILQINILDHVYYRPGFWRSARLFQLQRSGYDLMKTTKALFFELMYDFRSQRWNELELPKLSLRELPVLAKLLGCPSFGSKETVFIRLLAQRELRFKLSRFANNPQELTICYKRESLRDMCQEAGIWRSGNKRVLSAGLLNWRDRCRARGQAFLAEMRSLAKDRPRQLSFRFLSSILTNLLTFHSCAVRASLTPG
jgi:hypothetical protein